MEIHQYENLIRKQIASGENWTATSGKLVALNFVKSDKLDESAARKIASTFDRCVAADCKVLALDLPTEPVPVYLYPDTRDLIRALGIRKNFAGGLSLGSWAAIIYPQNGSDQELEATGAHELGQALIHSQLGLYSCPLFAEGIAFYLQGCFRNAAWIAKPMPIEPASLTTLADLAQTPDDFLQGARFISYLIQSDKGDPSRIKQVLIRLNKERLDQIRGVGTGTWIERVNRTLVAVYGKPLSALESSWRTTYSKSSGG